MAKYEWKSKKNAKGSARGGFGNPEDAGIDSAHYLNLKDSAEAGYLKQQWDTKEPLQENKKAGPEAR